MLPFTATSTSFQKLCFETDGPGDKYTASLVELSARLHIVCVYCLREWNAPEYVRTPIYNDGELVFKVSSEDVYSEREAERPLLVEQVKELEAYLKGLTASRSRN